MITFHPSRHTIEVAAGIFEGGFAAAVAIASAVAVGTLVVVWFFA